MAHRGRHLAPRLRRISRTWVVPLTLVMSLVMGGVAWADSMSADADSLSTSSPSANAHTGTQQAGTTVEYDLSAHISGPSGNADNRVFVDAGDSVSVAITRTGDWLATPAGSPSSFSFVSYESSQSGKIRITVPCSATNGGQKQMNVSLVATPSRGSLSTSSITLNYNITATTPAHSSCAPANAAPQVAADAASVTVNEGSLATMTGTWSDADAGDTVTLNASVGTVIQSGSNSSGTWSWSYTPVDGPSDSQEVTIGANDGTASSSASFDLFVNNVAPTVAKPSFSSSLIACGDTVTLTGISFSDPGVNDDPWNVNIDWGDLSTDTNYPTANQGAQPNQSHSFGTPGLFTATVEVTDKDGDTGSNTSTNMVQVYQYSVDFLPPFDDSNPSALIVNKMKNGRVVPVKAKVFDHCSQTYLTDPTAEVTIKVTKTSGVGTGDPIEEYADAGQSSAGTDRFRQGDGFWIYNLDSTYLGLVVNNLYRVDVYVNGAKATTTSWAVLQPVK